MSAARALSDIWTRRNSRVSGSLAASRGGRERSAATSEPTASAVSMVPVSLMHGPTEPDEDYASAAAVYWRTTAAQAAAPISQIGVAWQTHCQGFFTARRMYCLCNRPGLKVDRCHVRMFNTGIDEPCQLAVQHWRCCVGTNQLDIGRSAPHCTR